MENGNIRPNINFYGTVESLSTGDGATHTYTKNIYEDKSLHYTNFKALEDELEVIIEYAKRNKENQCITRILEQSLAIAQNKDEKSLKNNLFLVKDYILGITDIVLKNITNIIS